MYFHFTSKTVPVMFPIAHSVRKGTNVTNCG